MKKGNKIDKPFMTIRKKTNKIIKIRYKRDDIIFKPRELKTFVREYHE
jgi:hypothetical protein